MYHIDGTLTGSKKQGQSRPEFYGLIEMAVQHILGYLYLGVRKSNTLYIFIQILFCI